MVVRRLNTVCEALAEQYPEESFFPSADNSPLPEREAAWLAGIGLRGASGLLILPPYGTYVFLGTILTGAALELPERPLAPDCPRLRGLPGGLSRRGHGGGRAGCVPLPVGADPEKGGADGEEEARLKAHPLIWGCDFCQRACPFNADPALSPLPEFSTDLVDSLENADLEASPTAPSGRSTAAGPSPGGARPLRRNLELKRE